MGLNRVIEQGRIPFDLKVFNEGDDKKMVVLGSISVRRNYKPDGAEYYPEDLLDFKAFGAKAKFINSYFEKGSFINLEGELRRNDDYEKDGETVRGQMYIHVTDAFFQEGGAKGENKSSNKSSGSKGAASKGSSAAKPSTAKKTNPLAARRNNII